VIVGGGVIGCAVARELGHAGLRVTVLERDEPGANASWAAAGMLSPLAEADGPDESLSLLLDSRKRYPELAATLQRETGVDVAYRDEGTLLVAFTAADEDVLVRRHAWIADAGHPVERLSGAAARGIEPVLSPDVRSALRFPGDHQVDNRLLAKALWIAAERAGADMRRGEQAVRLLRRGGRAVGVELAAGGEVEADWVVVAGGSWSGQLEGLPGPLPVRPVRGQLLAFHAPRTPLRHVVDSASGYLVPRRDGRIIVGATVEEVGFERELTPEARASLIAAATEMVPELEGAEITEHWLGFRPGTPDNRPILGVDPGLERLVHAVGHYRNGILLVPITARIVADLIVEGRPAVESFSIGRFRQADG